METRPGARVRGSADAGFEDELEIQAICVDRYGSKAVEGLAFGY